MRINWTNSTPDMNLPDTAKNVKQWANITDIFLIDPDFAFNSETDFITETVWKNGIGNGFIIPIHGVKEMTDQSEETIYNLNTNDYEHKSRDGKKRILFRLDPDLDWSQDLTDYNQQYWKVCFADRNKNLYGYLSGSQVLGIDTDMISVEDPKLGQTPSWTNIRIELSDITGLVIGKPSFNPSTLKNIGVTVQNITETSDITFQVVDTVCSVNIEGLEEADITITDDISGNISFSTFTDDGEGYYTISSASTLYAGTITVFNTDYNGSATYSFTVPQYNPTQYNNSQYNVA